ncbi:MAG: fimbrillin family protein [Prevotella sp.]|nr:fimbrillin family protein [Prevotella sp.]
MTKKIALSALVAVGVFCSCSQSSDLVNDLPTPSEKQKVEEKTSISFDTYNAKSAIVRSSRAGYAGDMTTAMLQKEGFGVIAYYTASTNFSSWSIEAPNFMYNTKVSVAGANGTDPSNDPWTYSPTVYWPNGNATADNAGAAGAGGGKLSFFAYAPYTAVTPNTGVATGDATSGIKGLTSNSSTSAPSVSYSLNGGVDLLWGTAGTNGAAVSGNTAQAGTTLTDTGGKAPVNVDLTKMKTNGKVNFLFKHALARIGSINVLADIDNDGAATGGSLSNTKIYVESVTIENGVTTGESPVSTLIGDGTLDLTTGVWTPGSNKFTLSKSISGGSLNSEIRVASTDPETVGTKTWEQIFTTAGVTTTTPTSIFSSGSASPIMLIPGADQNIRVSISYYVTSKDDNLSRGYTWIPQTVSKTISLGTLEMNKSYSLTLHLGLNSVKFTASVSDWDNAASSLSVDLPVNVVGE